MKITPIENGRIAVDTPYNPEFIRRIKQAGGRWDASRRVWICDARDTDMVREIMRDVYGRDDMPQEVVSVRVTVGEEQITAWRGPVVLFGRTIASAFGRDSGARVGDGVAFSAGGATSGGTMKHWYTVIRPGSVFVVHDVPRAAVEQKLGWDDDYGTYEIIEPDTGDGASDNHLAAYSTDDLIAELRRRGIDVDGQR